MAERVAGWGEVPRAELLLCGLSCTFLGRAWEQRPSSCAPVRTRKKATEISKENNRNQHCIQEQLEKAQSAASGEQSPPAPGDGGLRWAGQGPQPVAMSQMQGSPGEVRVAEHHQTWPGEDSGAGKVH